MSNWWASRLSGGAQSPAPFPAETRADTPPPRPAPIPHTRRAVSQGSDERCPACNSQNYMSPPGNQYKRCFDCGYPITQSGSGVGSTSTDTRATPAVQVAGGGFNPKQIVGRVE